MLTQAMFVRPGNVDTALLLLIIFIYVWFMNNLCFGNEVAVYEYR